LGLRVGGPYTVVVSYIGYEEFTHNNIFLSLGVTADVNTKLNEGSVVLGEVVVTSSKNDLFSSDRSWSCSQTFGRDALKFSSKYWSYY
jgi:hypothetical protein